MWQDFIFLLGGFAFALLLVPTLRDKSSSVPVTTSGLTGTILLMYAFTFLTLDLFLSAFANLLTAAAWFAIAIWRRPDPETK